MEEVSNGAEKKDIFSLPQLNEEQFENAMKEAGDNTEDTYAVLLKDGKFVFFHGSWAAQCAVLTEDMIAASYLGTGEKEQKEKIED